MLACLGMAFSSAASARVLSQQDQQIYRAAFRHAEADAWSAAHQTAARATDPVLRDVLRWLELRDRQDDAPFEEIARFVRAHPDWPGIELLRRHAELAMPLSLPASEILAWFDRFPPLSAGGTYLDAVALRATGRGAEADRLIRARWPDIPLGATEQDTILAAFGDVLTQEDHERRLDTLLWQDRQTESRQLLPLVSPGHRALGEARMRLASRLPGVDAAVARVPPQLRDHPGLVYERVRWRRRADLTDGAIDLLAAQPDVLSHPRVWWTERNILARRRFEERRYRAAYDLVSAHRQSAGLALAQAEWMSGWLALRFLDQPEVAFRHFQRLHRSVSTPISLSRGAYWSGRALEAMGRISDAQAWYGEAARFRTAFYGQLAAGRLDQPSVASLPVAPAVTAADRSAFEASPLARSALALHQIGEARLAERFVRHLALNAGSATDFHLVAELARSIDSVYLAIRVGKAAVREGVELIEATYPIVPLPTADQRVEPALVLALIRQESEFRLDAVSRAGARGLMQLMPATARAVSSGLGIAHDVSLLTSDALHNVRLGSTYIADGVERFAGSYVLAIAAYNAGPTRVLGWVDELGDPRDPEIDVIDWIESLPVYETRNYVQRVLESLQVYRLRLGDAARVRALEKDLAP